LSCHTPLLPSITAGISTWSVCQTGATSGLGDYFTDCLFEDLERLEREAGIHATVYGLHRKLSKKFPFAIYYRMEGSLVDIVAILDCRRDPDSIEARLGRTSG